MELNQCRFIGNKDLKELEKLHKVIEKYKEKIFTDFNIQDTLLHRGYETEEPRPTSFHQLYDSTYIRTRTSIHLGVLEKMIETATKPHLITVQKQPKGIIKATSGMIYPNYFEENFSFKTPEDYGFQNIEDIQKNWFNEPETVEQIRNFQSSLNNAFDEFNLNFILVKMYKALDKFIPEGFETHNVQQEIIKGFGDRYESVVGERFSLLNNAYYNSGKRFFHQAGRYWLVLNESDFGKMFILSHDEEKESIKQIFKNLHS